MADSQLTISQYLSGKVRNITVPDQAVTTMIMDAGCTDVTYEKTVIDPDTGEETTETVTEKVTPETDVTLLSDKERELCLAWLYVWVAGSPIQSGGFTEEDADWRSSDNGERMSAGVLRNYLAMANKIFEKYGLDTISTNKWGFVGGGFHNIRKYK